VRAHRPGTEVDYALKLIIAEENLVLSTGFVRPNYEALEIESPAGWHAPIPTTLSALVRSSDGVDVRFRREPIVDLAEALRRHRHTVLLGAPGAGKTTLLRAEAVRLATNFLRNHSEPLPLYISLGEVSGSDTPSGMLIDTWRRSIEAPGADSFAQRLEAGSIVLLLDGLNEMPRQGSTDPVQGWMAFLESVPQCSVLISCRVRDYDVPLRLAQVEVLPFSTEQKAELAVRLLGRDRGSEFMATIRASGRDQILTTPFSITVLAWLFASRSEFAGASFSELLHQYVRILSKHAFGRFQIGHRGDADIALQELAWELQGNRSTVAVVGTSPREGFRELRVGREKIVDFPAPALEAALSAGLLVSEGAVVKFAHQSFQEVLAAAQLVARWEAGVVDLEALLAETESTSAGAALAPWERLPPPTPTGWEEPVVHAAHLAQRRADFLSDCVRASALVGGQAVAATEPPARVADLARQRLTQILADDNASIRRRIHAGDLLSAIGDPRFRSAARIAWPTADFVALPGFPRVALSRFHVTVKQYAAFVADQGYRRPEFWSHEGVEWLEDGLVEGGAVDRMLAHLVVLRESDRTLESWARFRGWRPETLAFWRELVAHSEARARDLLVEKFRRPFPTCPAFWSQADYSRDSYPVVGITWYEASAFASWASSITAGRLRLPTSEEWRAAGRNTAFDDGPYPWGIDADPEAANVVESHVLRPAVVGCFPRDRGPTGVYDLVGNAREWTQSVADEPQTGLSRPQLVVCGGGWSRSLAISALHLDDHFAPDFWDYNLGFRLNARGRVIST
jgi:formylglycine-generating enzyme required for sulfatase activity